LQDHELEGLNGPGDNDVDALAGTWVPFHRTLTGKAALSWDDRRIQKLLAKSSNLFDIPVTHRGTVYRYFERMVDKKILQELKKLFRGYQDIVENTRITKVGGLQSPGDD
jgi:hypothetical protein